MNAAPSVADPMAGVLTPRVAPPAPHGHAGRPRALENVDTARATWVRMLERHVDVQPGDDACWLWLGGTNDRGYGRVALARAGRMGTAHVVALVATTGELVPVGMVVDHLCRQPSCVRPAHLRVLTARENTLAGLAPSARNARAATCHRGHPLAGDNLRSRGLREGWRDCRACSRRLRYVRHGYARHGAALLGILQSDFHSEYGYGMATHVALLASRGVDVDALTRQLETEAAIRFPVSVAGVAA